MELEQWVAVPVMELEFTNIMKVAQVAQNIIMITITDVMEKDGKVIIMILLYARTVEEKVDGRFQVVKIAMELGIIIVIYVMVTV